MTLEQLHSWNFFIARAETWGKYPEYYGRIGERLGIYIWKNDLKDLKRGRHTEGGALPGTLRREYVHQVHEWQVLPQPAAYDGTFAEDGKVAGQILLDADGGGICLF